jgi:uncharacterized SAM-binding protein YcdF (DUF218 family)
MGVHRAGHRVNDGDGRLLAGVPVLGEKREKKRLSGWRRGTAAVILIGIGAGTVILYALGAVIMHYGAVDRARPADVIIVLGGGDIGTTRRTIHAVALYRQGYAPFMLCTGNVAPGEPISEADRCAEVARQHGVSEAAIITDEISRSTEENAIQSAAIMRAHGWQNAVLVSDDYHLWRAKWLFEEQGITAWPSPAQVTTGSLPVSDLYSSLLREEAAVVWQVGKTLLGLPYTRVGN